jgi:hypothetical protein
MKRLRELIVVNVVALILLLVVLLIGWREEAAFGLAVLVIIDLMVLMRGRQARSERDMEEDGD